MARPRAQLRRIYRHGAVQPRSLTATAVCELVGGLPRGEDLAGGHVLEGELVAGRLYGCCARCGLRLTIGGDG